MKTKIVLFCLSFFFILQAVPTFSQTRSITFNARLSTDLPKGETVCVYLREREGVGEIFVFPLTDASDNNWTAKLDFDNGWLVPGVTYHYKYCRNYIYNGADESVGGNDQALREVIIQGDNTNVSDTITQWRWWPVDGAMPSIDTSNYLHTPPANLPDSTFQCGIELQDYWTKDSFVFSVAPTFDRIKSICKATYIEYNPVPEIHQFYPTPVIIEEGANGTPRADLISILTEAKNKGLKVYLDPFAWAMISDSSPNYHTNDWWIAYEKQWRPVILDYAQVAQDFGVDVFTFGMWPSRWSVSQQEAPIVDSLAQNLLQDVKQIYKGKIAVEFCPWGPDLNLYNMADYLKFNIADYWPYTLSASKTPGLTEMLTNLNNSLDDLYDQGPKKWGKPILLSQIAASSFYGAIVNQPDWQTQLYFNNNDTSVPFDFQEQADVYEIFMQALSQRDWISGVYSFSYNYWNSLDKSPSIRSKPAEQVLAKWYGWINPQSTTDIKENLDMVSSFKLFQNFPNPFNPTTTIEFSVPGTQLVTLKVFDILGREIATLVNKKETPGTYYVKFNGKDYNSGIYFYQLREGNYTETRKFVLIK